MNAPRKYRLPYPPVPDKTAPALDLAQFEGHTPGPWEIHGDFAPDAYIHGANRICNMARPQGFYRSPAETERNAHLIAAVPLILNRARELEIKCSLLYGALWGIPESSEWKKAHEALLEVRQQDIKALTQRAEKAESAAPALLAECKRQRELLAEADDNAVNWKDCARIAVLESDRQRDQIAKLREAAQAVVDWYENAGNSDPVQSSAGSVDIWRKAKTALKDSNGR